MKRLIEIRSYNLNPAPARKSTASCRSKSYRCSSVGRLTWPPVPPSLHGEDSYYLIRSYASLEDRVQSQDAFYGSDDWEQDPREASLALIESYASR